MIEREVVILGLGALGKKVNADLKALLSDRRSLLPASDQDRIGVFQLDLECDAPFDFEDCHGRIEGATRNSYSRNNNLPFDFYLVGNLGESAVALQAVEIAYLLHVMDRSGILRIEDAERPGSVVSFFTYSDLLGSSKAYSEDQVSAFVWFLQRCGEVSKARNYQPPFMDPNGKPFSPVLRAPFDRNYLIQTPGDEAMIMEQTARVFCERLFIELMILEPDYKRNVRKAQRNMTDSDSPFCSFSFYEVPRLADLQRYMLKFRFEDFCLELAKGRPLAPSVEKSVHEKFRRLFDLEPGKEGEFPADRIAGIFRRHYANAYKSAIVPYVGGGDTAKYAEVCEANILSATESLGDAMLAFLRDEFASMKGTFIDGTRVLFQAPALYGYFAYYLDFLEELREQVKSWASTDFASDAEKDRTAFAEALAATRERLEALDKSRVLRFPLFVPLRRELAERLLAALPFDRLVDAGVKDKLGEYLKSDYLDPSRNSDHPLHVIDELVGSLRRFIAELSERQAYVKERLRLIDGMLDCYYVKSYASAAENRKTMERVALKYFSETRKSDLRSRYQKEIYSRWKQTFRDAAEFLHREEDFALEIKRNADKMLRSQEITALLEIDREASSNFCSRLDSDIRLSLDRLAERSFKRIQSRLGREDELIINPRTDEQDDLAGVVARMGESGRSTETAEWDAVLPIDREFTLGAVFFLRELLFMPVDSLAKWDRLKDYAGSDIKAREASLYGAMARRRETPRDSANATTLAGALTRRQKAIRMIVKEHLPGDVVLGLYGKAVGARAPEVTDGVVEDISRRISPIEALDLLTDDDLRRVAREFDVIAGLERARTIKNIVHYIDSL
jgi:hypothetical protein